MGPPVRASGQAEKDVARCKCEPPLTQQAWASKDLLGCRLLYPSPLGEGALPGVLRAMAPWTREHGRSLD